MEKEKRISSEQLLSQKKANKRMAMWHGIAVSVRTLLPIREVTLFINSVMDSCYDTEHDNFVPEMMDFAFRVNVVTRYACVDLPLDIEDKYEVLYNTDIFDTIAAAVNNSQLQSIRETIFSLMYRR